MCRINQAIQLLMEQQNIKKKRRLGPGIHFINDGRAERKNFAKASQKMPIEVMTHMSLCHPEIVFTINKEINLFLYYFNFN